MTSWGTVSLSARTLMHWMSYINTSVARVYEGSFHFWEVSPSLGLYDAEMCVTVFQSTRCNNLEDLNVCQHRCHNVGYRRARSSYVYNVMWKWEAAIKPKKSRGCFLHPCVYHLKILYFAHWACLCFSCGSQNKQQLFPYQAFIDYLITETECVYCAVRTES